MKNQGWFGAPDGTVLEVHDHLDSVRAAPTTFGFTPEEAAGWTRADRVRVLTQVLQRGWVRARRRFQEALVLEVWAGDSLTIERVVRLAEWIGGRQAVVSIISTGRTSIIDA